MTEFRVFLEGKETGERGTVIITADTPEHAVTIVRKQYSGAIIVKIKRVKA